MISLSSSLSYSGKLEEEEKGREENDKIEY
jgi:hypothetical protein